MVPHHQSELHTELSEVYVPSESVEEFDVRRQETHSEEFQKDLVYRDIGIPNYHN
jgi:hypothetical protein